MNNSNEKILISIVIPTYERPIYLKRAIDSALAQDYKNTEIIVVDDNDSDSDYRIETEKLLNSYSSVKNVIYLKHETNKNGSAARNTGLKFASGQYIMFLDDDDEILPARIRLQVDLMEQLDNTWGACYTKYKKIKGKDDVQISSETRQGELYVEALMRSVYIGSGSNLLVRKSIADEIGGYDESFKRNQDFEFLARLLENYKLAYIDECTLIVHYEIRGKKGTYEDSVATDTFYINKFRDKIDAVSPENKRKVFVMIALERFRYSVRFNKVSDGFRNLWINNVSVMELIRYCIYAIHRAITKKAYGFKL
ncbi:glycosyltransferase [Acetobacterium fimetarium]|uniref:Glycosyltransferase n=1 Tax=Acetobacterium fimetarium TaxID=52691 RepID=A0ABR6WZN0_9FIRM|nr:glycosyltransferase family 2 protein [Acetobacterium fimetarium]MBC3805604.1 glycosyltransferase [Acetobacterium fimetarium]